MTGTHLVRGVCPYDHEWDVWVDDGAVDESRLVCPECEADSDPGDPPVFAVRVDEPESLV